MTIETLGKRLSVKKVAQTLNLDARTARKSCQRLGAF